MKLKFRLSYIIAGCTCGIAIMCSLLSCSSDDKGEQQAGQLLVEARTALTEQQFERSWLMLDSLRTTYPRAVGVRRAALLFEDTLRLEEAKAEKAITDSIYDNACLDREELRQTGIDTLSSQFKVLRDRADSLRYAADRAMQKVRFFERKINMREQ